MQDTVPGAWEAVDNKTDQVTILVILDVLAFVLSYLHRKHLFML